MYGTVYATVYGTVYGRMVGDKVVPSGGGRPTVYGTVYCTRSRAEVGVVFAGRSGSTVYGTMDRAAVHGSKGRLISSILALYGAVGW